LAVLAAGCTALLRRRLRRPMRQKTLRVAFSIAETSFDPQFASDAASDSVISNIYEQMLDYDYLARPVKLVPRTLEAMPTVSDGGKTYTFKIRKGIFFTPDAAFKGKAARADRGRPGLRL
jgi:ABC-type transport system substrate-binding protein